MTPFPRLGLIAFLLGTLISGNLTVIGPRVCQAQEGARLELFPPRVHLNGHSARQQMAVSRVLDVANASDATREARFEVAPAELADVSVEGVVTPRAPGAGLLRVVVGDSHAEVPLLVEHPERSEPARFRHDVTALLSRAGCNMGACHGNLNGKGGFKLSLRGFDPDFDFRSLTRDSFGRRVDRLQPETSLLVLKATGRIPHEGGPRFPADSPEARALVEWVASGAGNDVATAPRVARLDVYPSHRLVTAPARAQQLVVIAEFTDGSRRDVTRQAAYDVDDPTRASVSVGGRVEVTGPVETTVAVRYLEGRAVSRLVFLQDRPGFAWRGPKPRNVVDELVFRKLREIKVAPSELSTDPVFLRRAYLDALGRLPTVEETRAFLADSAPEKRGRLIARLVEQPEFADFWALKWADLLRNEEKTMGVKGVWVFQRWLRDQIDANVPLDAFARALITAKGSTWSNPPASFYRTNRDASTAAESFGQIFLGVRLQCARCHNHPFDNWTQDDYYGLAAYFSNVRQKEITNERRDRLDKHEINGDEFIYIEGEPSTVHPRTGSPVGPKPPNGPVATLNGQLDARANLANWLTRDNRQFARNMANRVWFHLLGRGVVHPVDDFRESNPPSNPELLDALTDRLIADGYQWRPLVRLIMESATYQLASEPNETNADDEANFARAIVRLLPAEVLLDAIGDALDRPGRFDDAPRDLHATQLPGARMGGVFLKVFGKPDRLLTCECERSESTTLAQAFQLINGEIVRSKLESSENRIGRLLNQGVADEVILDDLVLGALGREPSATEQSAFLAHVRTASDRRKGWEDVAWAILNSKEFLLRH